MAKPSELDRLLSLVVFNDRLNHVEGLEAFRDLLERDADGSVLRFLKRGLGKLEGRRRGGLAFVVAEHYLRAGDLKSLRKLFATDDDQVKRSTLNALWGKPSASVPIGPGIVQLAIEATVHPAPGVRGEACRVFQNQCGWGIDVSDALEPLRTLLQDPDPHVRQPAAYAVGNLAKHKYDMSAHIVPLRRNVKHKDIYVRNSSAWALRALSQHKHDIGAAVPDLVQMLTDDDEWSDPRRTAVAALLHHARKSPDNAGQVKQALRRVRLDLQRKELQRFVEQLPK